MKGGIVQELNNILQTIDGGDILDFGTGNGRFARLLMEKLDSWNSVTGVDLLEPERCVEPDLLEHEATTWQRIDAPPLPFEDEQFDTVSIARTLHHIAPDTRMDTLQDLLRVLKPGGAFIVDEPVAESATPAQQTQVLIHHWRADVDQARGVDHYHTLGKPDLLETFDQLELTPLAQTEHCTDTHDPMDKARLDGIANVMQRQLMAAVISREYGQLKAEGEQLRQRMYETGYTGAVSVTLVGVKP